MADATNKVATSTQIVHIGSGTSLAAGAVAPASDVSVALSSTNLAKYPSVDVVLKILPTASIALASNTIALLRRDINIDSTNDEKAADTSNLAHYVGSFVVPASTTVSTTHYLNLCDVPIPANQECEFSIQNNLGVNVPVGWTLKVTPRTLTAATT